MGFWGKLGKIALSAAPYVAAPFTGGASLMAAPMANKAVGAWNQKDAEKNAAKGLAPSKFDNILGKVGNYASMASDLTGGFGGKFSGPSGGSNQRYPMDEKIGSYSPTGGYGTPPFAPTDQGGGWQDTLKRILGGSPGSEGTWGQLPQDPYRYSTPPYFPSPNSGGGGGGVDWQGALASIFGGGGGGNTQGGGNLGNRNGLPPGAMNAVPRGGNMRGLGPVMGARNQNNPNLALSIGQGRQEAMMNQPWRGGYQINTQGPDDSTITNQMPSVLPNYGARRRMNPAAEQQ